MTTPPKKSPPQKDDRKDRLAQALRDNLRKRKEQERGREVTDPAPVTPTEGAA
ncbi:hypothetical protein HHL28_10105 [Aerophototrophica crusticola]|uniref:Uncharacterized protein n=1 Tax=Aerophototrophica crusticola TaxID=1709002 RepID=A0A858R751_9PROT|nr:hypothetical protein HHL28_10105 [Rhodospirillaceae bacterium B3]